MTFLLDEQRMHGRTVVPTLFLPLMLLMVAWFPTVRVMGQAVPAGVAGQPPKLPILTTSVAFPNLRFDRPVALAYPDDGSGLLFVVEQHAAKIWSFPD